MKVVLLRVGIDSGCGGIQGPLFQDGTFELICIPDKKGIDSRTYGNSTGRSGRPHVEYFPPSRRARMLSQSVHVDPEFDTFTYGDPTSPKASLRKLASGDLLVFYAGLEGFDFHSPPALYLVGYFEVTLAVKASVVEADFLHREFGSNFHVRHPSLLAVQKPNLVLVKGGIGSRLLSKAVLLSEIGRDCAGKPLKVVSTAMRRVFGDFGGRVSIQRSPPRWVDEAYIEGAARFIRSLP